MKQLVRLISLTLCCALLLSPLPVRAAAVVAVRELDAPQAGELLDFAAVPAFPSAYVIEEICWYRASGAVPATYDVACVPGEAAVGGRYLCRVYLSFGAGSLPKVGAHGSIGESGAVVGQYRGRYFIEAEFVAKPSTRIAAVSFGGIDIPVAGGSVASHTDVALTVPIGCSVREVSWSIGSQTLAPAFTFRAGDALSCAVTVVADEGFSFTDRPTATLCGKEAAASVELTTGQAWRFVFLFTIAGGGQSGAEAINVGSVDLTATLPAAGGESDGLAVTASHGVTVLSAQLAPDDGTLLAGRNYLLTVTLAPADGFVFPVPLRPVVRLNGATMEVVSVAADRLTATATITPYAFPFTDVPEGAWYRATVEQAHRLGLINGKSATTYVPAAEMNYAEAVKLAACLHQLSRDGRVTLSNGTPWYQSYLDYCREVGIIDDAQAKEIAARAGEPITRAAYVTLFVRAMPEGGLDEINTIPEGAIPDVPADGSDTARAIYRFYRAGILNGRDTAGTFSPNATINRGEVATILVRLVDASKRVGPPSGLRG